MKDQVQRDDSKWNAESLSNEFLRKAEGADHYLREIRTKVGRTKTYELIYDQTLAEFWVFNYLHGKTFLNSRIDLVAELRRLLEVQATPHDAYELKRFQECRKRTIESLIERFESILP